MNYYLIIFTIFCIILQLFCLNPTGWHRRDPVSLSKRLPFHGVEQMEAGLTKYKWDEEWFEEMDIDHFSFGDSRKFRLR